MLLYTDVYLLIFSSGLQAEGEHTSTGTQRQKREIKNHWSITALQFHLVLNKFRVCQVGGRRESLCRNSGGETSWRMETSWWLCLDPEDSNCCLQRVGLWLCCFCRREKRVLREICVVDQVWLCSVWICSEGVCIIIVIRLLFFHPVSQLFR